MLGPEPLNRTAVLQLGFRIFFLGAGAAAVLLILAWTFIYQFSWQVDLSGIPATYWHAHEMIFGYTMAVVAGFMLTAAGNWTNIRTLHGIKLLGLFLLWAIARIVPFTGSLLPVPVMAAADILFITILLIHISLLLFKTNQQRQFIFLLMLLLLLSANAAFYTGLMQKNLMLMIKGIYTGLYLILGMIIVMGGRVIPFFIERGAGYPVELISNKWLEVSCISLFVIFWIMDVFTPYKNISMIFAGILFLLHGWRMLGWYTGGIWKKPLLWVLYLAYAMLTAGFLLRVVTGIFSLSPFLAVHAFGYGGVGVMTLGMMCRVSWGHTGRAIASPPRFLPLIFIPVILGGIVRSLLPLFFPDLYIYWIGLSQGLWIFAFLVFLYIYIPVLVYPRVDAKSG